MDFTTALDTLSEKGLYRELRERPGTGARLTAPDGRAVRNFSSNDYLDLAKDSRIQDAACDAVRRWGCGATASRLMTGHLPPHAALEAELARWLGSQAALVFGSGYLANLGLVSCLADAGAMLFMDRLNHASLIDGAKLAGARIHRYSHGDPTALESLLSAHGRDAAHRVVLTESVFSMDGDIAPLGAIAQVCARHRAWLVVDEAHALGVFGPNGAGCWTEVAAEAKSLGVPMARVGTLSKALGSYGGFVAGSESLVRLLVNRARGFIYSTGLAPACLGAALGALDVLARNPGLGRELQDRAAVFRTALESHGLATAPSVSHIVPVAVGDNNRALAVSRALESHGILCTAVRPPTVPPGTARLRFSVTLGHTERELRETAATVAQVLKELS